MKPLSSSSASQLLERIEYAKGGELRFIDMKDPTTFTITFSVQDRNREFDWINIVFEISGIHDARFIDDDKFIFVDMSEGISVLFENDDCGLLFGDYSSLASANDAVMYIIGKSIKYEELPFSE